MVENDRAPKLNRQQRRDEQFHRGRRPDQVRSPWTADDVPANQSSITGGADQDQTEMTGAGTGGATESSGRVINREGLHPHNSPK
jgi:hypothetical protein